MLQKSLLTLKPIKPQRMVGEVQIASMATQTHLNIPVNMSRQYTVSYNLHRSVKLENEITSKRRTAWKGLLVLRLCIMHDLRL